MQRESFKSKLGFIFAAAGSAVGLANVWRFPYIVGQNGGAAFVAIYLICLALLGYPVFFSEILIGRATKKNPARAFEELGGHSLWRKGGFFTILTGFLISAFYSVIASWILAYLIFAFKGDLVHFVSDQQAEMYFKAFATSSYQPIIFHAAFILLCFALLYTGVRKGLEKSSKLMVPFLIIILLFLAFIGLSLPGAKAALDFYFKPDFSLITPKACLVALGHAFFTLSLGQGTMVTYGSYLNRDADLTKSCFPIALIDTAIALIAGLAIFPIVFSVGLSPSEGPSLIFYSLPLVFSQLKIGYLLAVLFFLLLVLAALTSNISALEPLINYLMDEKKWPRKKAVTWVSLGSFALGFPLLYSNFMHPKFLVFGKNLFDQISFMALDVMVPIGGFLAVILVAWKWGLHEASRHWIQPGGAIVQEKSWLKGYLWISLKYIAPLLLSLVFFKALGIL